MRITALAVALLSATTATALISPRQVPTNNTTQQTAPKTVATAPKVAPPAPKAAPPTVAPPTLVSPLSLFSCPGPYKGPYTDSYHWEWTKQPVARPICPVKQVGPTPERQLLSQWWRQSCNTPCTGVNGTAAGDLLFLNYNLTLPSRPGAGFIDSTYDVAHPNGNPFNFTLGAVPRLQVVSGFDAALYGMCKGEKRAIKVSGAGGYGTNGAPPIIPACAELYFNVELVDFTRGNATRGINGTAPKRT